MMAKYRPHQIFFMCCVYLQLRNTAIIASLSTPITSVAERKQFHAIAVLKVSFKMLERYNYL